MRKLNMNPDFVEIMEAYGIDTSKVSLNENGTINCGEHGNWTCGNHYDDNGISDFVIAYQARETTKSSWRLADGKLEFLCRINTEAQKMTAAQLYKNMHSFYKQGNTLVKTFEWLKDAYGNSASDLMIGFMKKYPDDKELRNEFDKSCFIK